MQRSLLHNGRLFSTAARPKCRTVIKGVGGFIPDEKYSFTNEELFSALQPMNWFHKDGPKPVPSSFMDEKTGIRSRRLFLNRETLEHEEGAPLDSEMAIFAGRDALNDAGFEGSQLSDFRHVTCTPDYNACQMGDVPILKELSINENALLETSNLGCAGLAPSFNSLDRLLRFNHVFEPSEQPKRGLLVASNCPSGFMTKHSHDSHRNFSKTAAENGEEDPSEGWSWSAPAFFADGAAAVALEVEETDERGFLATSVTTNPDQVLVTNLLGGCARPPSPDNTHYHAFLMNAAKVGDVFPSFMKKNMQELVSVWTRDYSDILGEFNPRKIKRYYMHQANALANREFGKVLGFSGKELEERIPVNADYLGNTVTPSSLLLLHDDWKAGNLQPGDVVAFLWIGAGAGAQRGWAIYRF